MRHALVSFPKGVEVLTPPLSHQLASYTCTLRNRVKGWNWRLEMNSKPKNVIRSWLVLFAMLVPMAFSQNSGTVQGTVYALPGSTVSSAVVIACVVVNDTCSETLSKVATVQGTGSSGKYQLSNLGADSYLMLAWRDLNGTSDLDAGDEVGVYSQNGKAALVKAPASSIDMRLKAFTGDADALLVSTEDARNPQTAPQASGSMVGAWSTVDILPDSNNSDTGRYVGSNNSFTTAKFDAKGGYELTEYIYITTSTGCSNWIFTTTSGTYNTSAQQVSFAPKTSNQINHSGCYPATSYTRKNDSRNLEPFKYWWKLELDQDGREVLSLLRSNLSDWFYADHLHRSKK